MTTWLTEQQARTLGAACDRLIPPDGSFPGANATGAVAYVDGLLDAFAHDPPHIWAAGAGTATGERTEGWLRLGPGEAHAWRRRVEGWQAAYRSGLAGLGADFADLDGEAQDERLAHDEAFRWQLYEHCCEAVYGDPAYGGNQHEAGWRSIAFPGPPFPRGYTPDEVTGRA